MSDSDLILCASTESAGALAPDFLFAPPQPVDAPSPESFDKEVTELLVDLDLPSEKLFGFPPPFDDSMSAAFTSPILTYSTDSVQEVSSHYSCDFTQSDYSIPSGIDSYGSLNYGTDNSIYSAISNSPPSIPPLHSAKALADYETSGLNPSFVGISLEGLSTAVQQPTSVVPTSLPVSVTPASEAQTAPAPDKPFDCPHCPRTFARNYNMKQHIADVHDKLKPFGCSTCGHHFSRKHDLHRHCTNPKVHRKQMSSLSVSSTRVSKRRFNPKSDSPHRITIKGDPRLTTSAHPDPTIGPNPATDLLGNIIGWV